jgi:hypothetical protein
MIDNEMEIKSTIAVTVTYLKTRFDLLDNSIFLDTVEVIGHHRASLPF